MKNGYVKQVTLDQLASTLLSDKVVNAINNVDVSNLEIEQQEIIGSTALRFVSVQGEFIFEMRLHLPIKKTMAVLAGLSSLVWALTHSEASKLVYAILAMFVGEHPTS